MSRLEHGLALYHGHRRYVSYRQAEDAAALLAVRLRQAMSSADLAAASFRAIPRGGSIVLAMLAYHLDLPRERLRGDGAGTEGDRPLVLVDDCALSGLRLAQELEHVAHGRRVVVGHLYSPSELRRAVLAREPRVEVCVAAHDLADLSDELFPDARARDEWQQRWRRRLAGSDGGERRFWLGIPELVAFAWNEPDRPLWNDATGAVEDGWRFEPPHRCLKNRARLARGLPAEASAPEDGAPHRGWQLAEGVIWGEFDGVVWLCSGGEGEVFSLDGSAALAWRALLAGGGETGAAAALTAVYRVDAESSRTDVAALIGELSRAGLLVARHGQPTDD